MQVYKYPNENSIANPRMMDFVYPEVFYKVQPFIMMACDQMDMYQMPTQAMVDKMADDIHDDVCRMYPDMAEYAQSYGENANADLSESVQTRDPRMFDRRFRRRGLFRDLIGILLLQELFGRRGLFLGRRFF